MTSVAEQPYTTSAPPASTAAGPVIVRGYTRRDAETQSTWPVLSDPLLESYNLRLSAATIDGYFTNLMARSDYVRFSLDVGGELIGTISLRDMAPGVRSARLGIVLRADLIGSGLGGEAIQAFLRKFFGTMGFEAMDLDVAAHNGRAYRCYERLGFRCVDKHWQAVEVAPEEVERITDWRRLQHYVRVEDGQVWILHHDMQLVREDYRARIRAGL